MYIVKKWTPARLKSPWALYKDDELLALFTYRKGAHRILELLMELEKMKRLIGGLHLIEDMVEPLHVADSPRRL